MLSWVHNNVHNFTHNTHILISVQHAVAAGVLTERFPMKRGMEGNQVLLTRSNLTTCSYTWEHTWNYRSTCIFGFIHVDIRELDLTYYSFRLVNNWIILHNINWYNDIISHNIFNHLKCYI